MDILVFSKYPSNEHNRETSKRGSICSDVAAFTFPLMTQNGLPDEVWHCAVRVSDWV